MVSVELHGWSLGGMLFCNPVYKGVYHSGCRDKHNRPLWFKPGSTHIAVGCVNQQTTVTCISMYQKQQSVVCSKNEEGGASFGSNQQNSKEMLQMY